MENKYVNGKIYKLVDNTTGDIYIGSTIKELKERLRVHKAKYQLYLQGKYHKYYSFKIFENNDFKIELLEDYPCNSKKELELKEREYIENNICVNHNIPTRKIKEYYEENRDKIIEDRTKKITCECGAIVSKWNIARHKKTLKHIKFTECVIIDKPCS